MNFRICSLVIFLEIKVIVCDIVEIKIPLNPDVKPTKQWLYRINLRYKEKFNIELDIILDAGIVESTTSGVIPMRLVLY